MPQGGSAPKLDCFRGALCKLLLPSFEDNFDLAALLVSFVPPPIGRLEGKTGTRPTNACRIKLSKDNQFLLTVHDDGKSGEGVKLWRTDDWSLLRTWNWRASGANCAISDDSKFVALTAVNAQRLVVWDWEKNQQVLSSENRETPNGTIAFSPDSSKLAVEWKTRNEPPQCGCRDCNREFAYYKTGRQIRVFDLRTGEYKILCTNSHGSKSIVWSDDSQFLFADCGGQNTGMHVKMWDVETGEVVKTLNDTERKSVCFISTGSYGLAVSGSSVLTCSMSYSGVALWDITGDGVRGKKVKQWQHPKPAAVCFSSTGDFALMLDKPNGKRCFGCVNSGNLFLLDLKTFEKTLLLASVPHTEKCHYRAGDVCITKDNSFAIFTGHNSWVQILHLDSQQLW